MARNNNNKNRDTKSIIPAKTRRAATRIVMDPAIMGGQPTIKDTRLTVKLILDLLAHGMTAQEILQEYSALTREDILECIRFAQFAVEQRQENPL